MIVTLVSCGYNIIREGLKHEISGSSVSDECRPASDIDICLVGNTTHDEEKRIYMTPKCTVDIIRETPEGFREEQNHKGSIYRKVYNTGVLIYKKGVGVVND